MSFPCSKEMVQKPPLPVQQIELLSLGIRTLGRRASRSLSPTHFLASAGRTYFVCGQRVVLDL